MKYSINYGKTYRGIQKKNCLNGNDFCPQFGKSNQLERSSHIKKAFSGSLDKVLYVSLDNLYFSDNSLLDFVDSFVKRGGKYLFLDEVHKYLDWSRAIKNIYDDYPELNVAFTGSSLLKILNTRSDLNRRALVYNLQGLSFREYLNLNAKTDFPILSLEEILKDNENLSAQIVSKIKPFEYFADYLENGYYPYFLEGIDDYYTRLNETVNLILEIELPQLRKLDVAYIVKIKKLLAVIGIHSECNRDCFFNSNFPADFIAVL